MIRLRATGNYDKAFHYFDRLLQIVHSSKFDECGRRGVEALREATPKETGRTADSWSYQIDRGTDQVRITWSNTNTNKGVNIAIILQLGHGTGTGGWVEGRDYINPAVQPVFDDMIQMLTSEVKRA